MFRIRRRVSCFLLVALSLTVGACDQTTPEEHLARATEQVANGAYRNAIIELKNALQKQSNLAPARALLGQSYLQTGDYPSALKEFERAVDLGETSAQVRLGLLRAKLGLGRVQEVIGELEGTGAAETELSLILAEAYLIAGNVDAARPLFEAGRDQSEGLAGLAAIAWQEGDLDGALKLYGDAIALNPKVANYWLQQGELTLRAGRYDKALESFEAAAKLPKGRVLGQIGTARTYLTQGQLEEASVAVEQVVGLAPDYPLARYLSGLIAYQKDDLEAAESSLRRVQLNFPDHRPTLYLLGLVKYQQGQNAQALSHLNRFLTGQPHNLSVRKLVASIHADLGDYEQVVAVLQPQAEQVQDAQYLALLGSALMQQGEASQASEYLQQAVELTPDGAAFRNQLALSLLSTGDEERAMAQLEAAIEVDGDQFESDYLRALVAVRNRDFDLAERAIRAIAQKLPESPIAPNLFGALALVREDQAEAIERFNEALSRDPGFAPARNNLARLYEEQGKPERAIELLRERVSAVPQDYPAKLSLAQLLARQSEFEEARKLAEDVVVSAPKNPQGYVVLARLEFVGGNRDAALDTLTKGLEASPSNLEIAALKTDLEILAGRDADARDTLAKLQAAALSWPPNAQLSATIGQLQLRLGELKQAERSFRQALELSNDENFDAELALTSIYLQRKDRSSAAPLLKTLEQRVADGALGERSTASVKLLKAQYLLLAKEPDAAKAIYRALAQAGNRDAALRLAALQLGSDAPDQGIQTLSDWLSRNEEDQGARLLLGGALLNAGREDAAISEYERLAESENPVVLNNLAWLYAQKNDDRALATAKRAYEQATDNADIADTYGWILVEDGKLEEGIRVLERGARRGEGNPTLLYHLGAALQRSGRSAEAREYLTQALISDGFPEREAAGALLKQLEAPADPGA